MTLTVCIGSACHLKGSRETTKILERLIDEHHLRDQIQFYAAFCMGNCQNGVSVSLDGEIHSVTPETAQQFFETEVLPRIGK